MITAPTRAVVLARDRSMCLMCGELNRLTAHHIKPHSISHDDRACNLATLCEDCHRTLHDRSRRLALWIAWIMYAPLFTVLRLVAPFRKSVAKECTHQPASNHSQRENATIRASDLTDVAFRVALESGWRLDVQKTPDGRYTARVFPTSKRGMPVTMAQAGHPMQALQLAGLRVSNPDKRIKLQMDAQ